MTDEEIIKALKKMNSDEILKADEVALENSLPIFDSLDSKRFHILKRQPNADKVSSSGNKKTSK